MMVMMMTVIDNDDDDDDDDDDDVDDVAGPLQNDHQVPAAHSTAETMTATPDYPKLNRSNFKQRLGVHCKDSDEE